MAQGQQFFVLSMIAIVLLVILSTCNSYPLFSELPIPQRSTKFYSQKDADRYVNRMKQYSEAMAHLRYWRRDIDQSNEDYDDTLENTLRQDKNFEYKR